MKKINSIKFKNFKAFFGEETIQLDGKNLLVYGENGSGKSSIFWGLYTFLQSSTKSLADVNKYFVNFDENNPNTFDSLKNIFADQAEDSYIELETATYKQTPGTTEYVKSGTITNRIDATPTANNKTLNNQHIGIANASSDFINYKLLHNFYNVTHKQEINLWEVFYKDVFPYYRANENPNEPYFRERIDDLLVGVPLSSGGAKRASGRPRSNFENKIQTLNSEINIFLFEIETNANAFLKEHFFDGKDYLQLHLTYPDTNSINYNSIWQKKNDYKIIMSVELYDNSKTAYIPVKRPHSFLNEALLTRLAISVRIGALMTRVQNRDYQILCLDDMLISLDMGNRDKVIQTFLNTQKKTSLQDFDKFQKLIFTHDKAFYNLCKQRIRLNLDETEWHFKEIYLDTYKIPQRPFIDNSTDYFERAEKHLKTFDYPASANALRQGLENLVFNFLPNNLRLTKERKGEELTVKKQFNDLLEALKTIHKIYKVDVSVINDLFIYKDNLLNPLSHDNIDTPVFKEEIEKVLSLVPLLKTLKSDIIKEVDKVPTIIKFEDIKTDTNELITYHFQLHENLLLHTLIDGSKHLSRGKYISLKYVYPNGREVIKNETKNSLFEHSKNIAFFLKTTYADDLALLSKLKLT